MGSKNNKKRFLLIYYQLKKDGKFDELVELTKKKIGSGKMTKAKVVLDLLGEEILKLDLDGAPKDITYKEVLEHYKKHYADAIKQFLT